MLKWMAKRTYNRFDVLWLVLVALAAYDHEWFEMCAFAVCGALISGFIEWMAERAT